MYPYLEISIGYGRKRRMIRMFDWYTTQSDIDSSGISNVFNPIEPIGFAREVGSTSTIQYSDQSDLFPTGSEDPVGNGSNNSGGNNGNGQTEGQDGNGNSNGNGQNGGGSFGNSGK